VFPRRGDRCGSALFDDRPFAAIGVEGAVPVKAASAGIVVLDSRGNRQRLVAELQGLIRIAEEPQRPRAISIAGRTELDAVFKSQMRGLHICHVAE
jgi:hypothetical protein